MNRIICKNRDEWLKKRKTIGIGASQAAAALGMNPWQSNQDLWELLTGRKTPTNLSDNDRVQYGVEAEPHIRALFQLEHPELTLEYNQYDILQSDDYPYMFATLDGELTETDTCKRGILEIKTAEPQNKAGWSEWDGQVPQHYYIQILHQLIVTGWDFAILRARLISRYNGLKIYEREYRFDRENLLDDMQIVIDGEKKFIGYVMDGKRPPLILPDI